MESCLIFSCSNSFASPTQPLLLSKVCSSLAPKFENKWLNRLISISLTHNHRAHLILFLKLTASSQTRGASSTPRDCETRDDIPYRTRACGRLRVPLTASRVQVSGERREALHATARLPEHKINLVVPVNYIGTTVYINCYRKQLKENITDIIGKRYPP